MVTGLLPWMQSNALRHNEGEGVERIDGANVRPSIVLVTRDREVAIRSVGSISRTNS